MLNFYKTRFAVGHICFVLRRTDVGLWRLDKELITIESVVIQTYHKSNFAIITYKCSDGVERKEGVTEKGEPLPNVLFGTYVEAKSACATRNQIKFS